MADIRAALEAELKKMKKIKEIADEEIMVENLKIEGANQLESHRSNEK